MASDPSELYDLVPDLPELGEVVLVQALDGFVDAGAAKPSRASTCCRPTARACWRGSTSTDCSTTAPGGRS